MKRLAPLSLLALLLALLAAGRAQATPTPIPDGPIQVMTHVLVQSDADPATWAAGRRVERVFANWYRLYTAPGQAVDDALSAAALSPGVQRVTYDYVVHVDAPRQLPAALSPGDPLYGRQWHMPQVQAEAAWDAIDGEGAVIAIIDTGVATAGLDSFCQPLHSEYNAMTNSIAPGAARDGYAHGTHVAGTAAGCTGNGIGVTGLAYGAQVMAVKVLDDTGNGSFSNVAEGIVWAADHGAGVINMSLGSACGANWPACSTAIVNDAIAYAAAADVVIVASAGNDNRSFVGQPGNHPEIIAVSAMDYNRNRAPYSNRGAAVDLGAPGGNTGADQNGDGFMDGVLQETFNRISGGWGYFYYQGTSMAAPHVAGAAGLLRSCVPLATRAEVRAALEATAADLGAGGFDTTYGNGFLQIHDALVALATQHGQDPAAGCAYVGTPPCLTVTTAVVGDGNVTLSPPSNCMAGSTPGYRFDTDLSLVAAPDPGNGFAGWSGDAGGATNPLSLTRYGNLSITATFAPCLSVTTTADGPGAVVVQPPPNCGADYLSGTALTLTATPDPGYTFTGWSGDASGTTNPLNRTLNDDLDVTASFAALPNVAISLLTDGNAGGLAYRDEDVLLYDGDWSLLFDGSAHALPGDVDALAVLPDGDLLISPDAPRKNLPGLGKVTVDDSDVVRFDAQTNQYSWYFDGSDVGLTQAAEDIDALAVLPDGDLLISTLGAVKVPGVNAADEDVLRFHGAVGSNATSGTWSLYIDGSDLSGSLGDIDAVAVQGGVVYLSALGSVTLGGQSVAPGDVFACTGLTPGANTACAAIERVWRGSVVGLGGANVDALEMLEP